MYPWKRGEGVAAVPAWARGHDDGHVVRDGVQQSGGRARQRWRCTLPDASYHRFLGVMSRTRALDETCVECENHLEVHEGPVAPSTFEYLVREVAGGQTVAEWMADFVPVVTARQQPTEWPPVLVLDSTRFRWNNHGQTYDLFSVLGAYGYDENGEHGRLWKLASAPANDADNWKAFLDTLPGRPLSVVCDRDLGIIGGVQRAWGRGKKAVPIH